MARNGRRRLARRRKRGVSGGPSIGLREAAASGRAAERRRGASLRRRSARSRIPGMRPATGCSTNLTNCERSIPRLRMECGASAPLSLAAPWRGGTQDQRPLGGRKRPRSKAAPRRRTPYQRSEESGRVGGSTNGTILRATRTPGFLATLGMEPLRPFS
jgi:hypothetical protein